MYALEIKNLIKRYKIYSKPIDRLKEIIIKKPLHKSFLALNDVSFNVPIGQSVGIIGDNGAGKSTLLKIIAGTLTPTSGNIIKNGSLAALLELGAGFHPEFTGRQNIYLNASLLGLRKNEIKKIEKEIIEFAELEDFIDIPVKTYSSGMYVRLAFSIATSINPDILIIDEALSVGDQHFQKKCIDRMHKFIKSGKTIIFCSHSLYHLQELCERGIWLYKGKIKLDGNIKDVIKEYQNYLLEKEEKKEKDKINNEIQKDKIIYISNLWTEDIYGKKKNIFHTNEDVIIKIKIKSTKGNNIKGHIGFGIFRADEILIFGTSTLIDKMEKISLKDNSIFGIKINKIPLLTGKYKILATIIDETGLHFYDIKKENILEISSSENTYGIISFWHDWIV